MNWLDRWVSRSLEREQHLVTRPGESGHLVLGFLGLGVLLVLTWLMIFQTGALQVVGQLALAVLAGGSVAYPARVKLAYRNGWLDGRRTFVATLEESQRRGIPPQVWLDTEYQRDLRIMGGGHHLQGPGPDHPDHL